MLQNMNALDLTELMWHLPLVTMDDAIHLPMKVWKEQFEHPQLDSWWEAERYQNKYDRVQVPVLHVSGWYDDEQIGTPLNYIGMTTKGPQAVRRSQKLLMGPWPHAVNSTSKLGEVDFGPSGKIDLESTMLRWFDAWLKGADNGVKSEPPVRIFVMGENRWVDENEWPLARTRYSKYYLHGRGRANSLFGDGGLTTESPASEKPDSFSYDPAKPAPFITEASFAQIGGPDDYRSVERRDDVLVYTSEPVTEETQVCGPVKVKLYAASSAKDTDFTAKLLDVWPDGFAQRLCDGMVRARFRKSMEKQELITPGQVYGYDIDSWNTCQTFLKGHKIRLEISSSAFPKYDRNPNTGAALGMTTEMITAQQTVYHDRQNASYVLLPIVPKKASAGQ
jgi:putative CocE/NonD family hydrolase